MEIPRLNLLQKQGEILPDSEPGRFSWEARGYDLWGTLKSGQTVKKATGFPVCQEKREVVTRVSDCRLLCWL